MGYRPYRGAVRTLEQAMFAEFPVRVTCKSCHHFRQLHAYNLVRQIGGRADAGKLPLWTEIQNLFYCRSCRKRVTVIITAPMEQI